MDIHDLFQSPASRIAAFAEMQLHLYRHDVRLQDYFEPLQLDTLTSRPSEVRRSTRFQSASRVGCSGRGQG